MRVIKQALPEACSRLSPCLMKNTHNLGFEFREFEGHHRPARMQDQIEALGQQIHVTPQDLAHAPLDAIALMSLAQHFARGETDAGPGRHCSARESRLLRREKPAHRSGLPLAAGGVGALIIGVPGEPRSGQRLNGKLGRGLNGGMSECGSTGVRRMQKGLRLAAG